MTGLHKFSLKKFCFTLVSIAFCIVITWKSEARYITRPEIYSTLTTDTIPVTRKDSIIPKVKDSTNILDTLSPIQRVDTFPLKLSKDTLDATVDYEASDSGVFLVKDKKFILYGKTKTNYKDVKLSAPKVELNQETNVMTAFDAKDSAGNITERAQFQQGDQGFQSDTIRFNFKTQRGVTTNTYTKQQEMFVQAQLFKKVNANTTFAKHVIMTTCDYDEPHFGFVGNKGKFINNKVAVTGPIHPEFEGVPLPIYLPFGIFPLQQGRHSGFLPPQFTVNEQYGLGLEGLGYYHVLNEYFDVTVRGNIYSYGGWSANLIPTYRKRYRYNGTFNLSLQHTKLNFKGDPDYSVSNTFLISWSHSMDSKAKPGTNFSANVNAGSTRYNQNIPNNPYRNIQNQLSSSINYSKTWVGKPFNLTLSANHNQNNSIHLINLTLPDAGFTVTTLYPFQRKEMVGAAKWYEKLGIGYSGVARNQISFYDYDSVKITPQKLLDTMLWGAQHRFPISMSLPPIGSFMISPFFSYEQTWLTHRIERRWDDTLNKIDTTLDQKGFWTDHQLNVGIGINTTIYGTFQFKHSKRLIAIRHVIRPNLNFNYKPNLSAHYYDVIPYDSLGHKQPIPQFSIQNNLFSGYGYGKYGGITFGLDNNLEMKWRSKKDTGANAIKKIRLIDGFGFTSGYNYLADSMKLLPFNLYLRSTLFEKVSLTAQAVYNPYATDTSGILVNRFVWQGNHFSLGRLNSGSISLSTQFQSKSKDPKQGSSKTPTRQINDPNLLADKERLQEYIRRNPAEFVDFNIPWSLGLSFSLFFTQQFQQNTKTFKAIVNSNISFNNSFSLTPKWNFTTNGFFDFNTMQLTTFTMSISRDMHCWQMSVNVIPIGTYRSFNISINPKSSILQDLHVNRTRTFYNY
jgi:LPS-assembly protein